MKIALLQWDTYWEDPESNFGRVRELLDEVVDEETPELVSLPELFATGFSMNVDELAEPVGGPTYEFLSKQAQRYDLFLQGSILERAGNRGKNVAIIFNPDGEVICRYAKIHPFSYADEDQYYEPGTRVETTDILGITVCPVICYDLRFPELFRKGIQNGAELFLVPANWPTARLDHWNTLLHARAIENQTYVAAANRTGEGNGLKYPGHSTLVDPWGETVDVLDDQEGVLIGHVDPERLEEIRTSYPFLQDKRLDVE